MSFIEMIQEKDLTIDAFLTGIERYQSLDQALVELPAEYMEFYLNNERQLEKATKRMFESETQGYTGWTPPQETVTKVVKYKGELIHMSFDPKNRHWVPVVAFRSVSQALKHGKKLIEDYK